MRERAKCRGGKWSVYATGVACVHMRDRLTLSFRRSRHVACTSSTRAVFRNGVLKCSRERLYYLTSCCALSCSGSTPLSYHTGVCLDAAKLNISVENRRERARALPRYVTQAESNTDSLERKRAKAHLGSAPNIARLALFRMSVRRTRLWLT
jgi:hypothetical protein